MAAQERIDGYATAILEIAKAEDQLERVGDELFKIARAIEQSAELRDALTDPQIPVERKQAILSDLLAEQTSQLSRSLVNFVVAAGHARELPDIADRLVQQAAAERNRVVAEVRTPVSLTDEQVERIAAGLGQSLGKQVDVKVVIDESVLGGVVARIGDTVIDGSVRHRLESLREKLLEGAER